MHAAAADGSAPPTRTRRLLFGPIGLDGRIIMYLFCVFICVICLLFNFLWGFHGSYFFVLTRQLLEFAAFILRPLSAPNAPMGITNLLVTPVLRLSSLSNLIFQATCKPTAFLTTHTHTQTHTVGATSSVAPCKWQRALPFTGLAPPVAQISCMRRWCAFGCCMQWL